MISFSTRFERFRVPLILATTFLDLLGFGVLIPIFPQILDSYDRSGAWM